jgi:predicted nucleic acid-binding protein
VGLILDTSILIESERRGEGVEDVLRRSRDLHGEIDVALSSVSAVELTHGIYRARTDADRVRRRVFVEGVFHDLITHPLTLEIAQLAGRIEGEQAAKGISIAVQDLIIGATALHLGFDVVTLNAQTFRGHPWPQCRRPLREPSFSADAF